MITREEMIGLLQILADLPSAETKQGRGARRRVEEAIAALQAMAWQSRQAQGEAQEFTDYDAGALNDWGGGDVGWWQDYIRSEIERANDHWREQTAPEHSGGSNEVPDWEPIETAPMDGTHIQLYRPNTQFIGYYGGANSGWRHNAPGLISVWPLPTHWRPLHDPPRQEETER